MSIINEALRKARTREQQSGKPPEGATSPEPPQPPPERRRPGWRFFLGPFFILLVFLGALIYGVVWVYQNATDDTPAADLPRELEKEAISETMEPMEPVPTIEEAPTDMVSPVLEAVTERVTQTQRLSTMDETPKSDTPVEPETSTEEGLETLLEIARTLRIEGVSLIPGNHRVLINGSFYGEGDFLREAPSITVREIRERHIVLEHESGAEHRLSY